VGQPKRTSVQRRVFYLRITGNSLKHLISHSSPRDVFQNSSRYLLRASVQVWLATASAPESSLGPRRERHAFYVRESLIVHGVNCKSFQDRDLSDRAISINGQAVSARAAYLRARVALKFAGNGGIRIVSNCLFYLRRRPHDEMDRASFRATRVSRTSPPLLWRPHCRLYCKTLARPMTTSNIVSTKAMATEGRTSKWQV
jgi:hypothetical protein